MKTFLAIYIGTASTRQKSGWDSLDEDERRAREQSGMNAWMEWGVTHEQAIVDQGGPVGKTKRVSPQGIADVTNQMVGYVIVQAESHEAAAKMFENHPHFSIFPGESVEIMERLPIPGM